MFARRQTMLKAIYIKLYELINNLEASKKANDFEFPYWESECEILFRDVIRLIEKLLSESPNDSSGLEIEYKSMRDYYRQQYIKKDVLKRVVRQNRNLNNKLKKIRRFHHFIGLISFDDYFLNDIDYWMYDEAYAKEGIIEIGDCLRYAKSYMDEFNYHPKTLLKNSNVVMYYFRKALNIRATLELVDIKLVSEETANYLNSVLINSRYLSICWHRMVNDGFIKDFSIFYDKYKEEILLYD